MKESKSKAKKIDMFCNLHQKPKKDWGAPFGFRCPVCFEEMWSGYRGSVQTMGKKRKRV